jgi:hypothetical protein
MSSRIVLVAVAAFLAALPFPSAAEPVPESSRRAPVRVIGGTVVVGESDQGLWRSVLDLLPARPRRIVILDLDSLSATARHKLRGLDAFVLAGQTTVVVIKQGTTLRQAELGDAIDRLVLASLVWHELTHSSGLDETAAIETEEALWRQFIASGRVDSAVGMAYIARLREERAKKADATLGELVVHPEQQRSSKRR